MELASEDVAQQGVRHFGGCHFLVGFKRKLKGHSPFFGVPLRKTPRTGVVCRKHHVSFHHWRVSGGTHLVRVVPEPGRIFQEVCSSVPGP